MILIQLFETKLLVPSLLGGGSFGAHKLLCLFFFLHVYVCEKGARYVEILHYLSAVTAQ